MKVVGVYFSCGDTKLGLGTSDSLYFEDDNYWLSSPSNNSIPAFDGCVYGSFNVNKYALYTNGSISDSCGLRPVVALKETVSGTQNAEGIWELEI